MKTFKQFRQTKTAALIDLFAFPFLLAFSCVVSFFRPFLLVPRFFRDTVAAMRCKSRPWL